MFYSKNHHNTHLDDTPKNIPDIHGFVMMGNNNLFIEHVPMFKMENHEYQCIMRASMPSDAMQAVNDHRRKKPKVPLLVANLDTDLYILPEVASGRRTSFEGEILIWETDDPRKNPRLIPKVTVTIEHIVHYRHFALQISKPSSPSYLLFGKRDEVFLSHYMNNFPDFMHLLQVAEQPSWLTPTQIEASVLINFPNLTGEMLKEQNLLTEISCEVQYEGKPSLYPITISRNIWWTKIKE